MGMQQGAGMPVFSLQDVSFPDLGLADLDVQALHPQIASGGSRRRRDVGEQRLDRIHGGTCGRSERNWYA
jgi:hypothetical protein